MEEKQKKGFRKAVFIVVYRLINSNNPDELQQPIYLILRRKKHWHGWEFPKGGIEENENPFQAAKRECSEESGLEAIKVRGFNVRGKYRYRRVFRDRPSYIGQSYVLFSCQVSEKGKVHYDEREHSKYKWLPFHKAIKKLTHKNQKHCLNVVNNFLINKKLKNI